MNETERESRNQQRNYLFIFLFFPRIVSSTKRTHFPPPKNQSRRIVYQGGSDDRPHALIPRSFAPLEEKGEEETHVLLHRKFLLELRSPPVSQRDKISLFETYQPYFSDIIYFSLSLWPLLVYLSLSLCITSPSFSSSSFRPPGVGARVGRREKAT